MSLRCYKPRLKPSACHGSHRNVWVFASLWSVNVPMQGVLRQSAREKSHECVQRYHIVQQNAPGQAQSAHSQGVLSAMQVTMSQKRAATTQSPCSGRALRKVRIERSHSRLAKSVWMHACLFSGQVLTKGGCVHACFFSGQVLHHSREMVLEDTIPS